MPKHTRATVALSAATLLLSAGVAHAALLYDNGSLINQPGAGAGGADVSALTGDAGTLGFSVMLTASNNFRLADDFTIAAGETWRLESVEVFGYQTNSSTTSTFTALTLRIWQGLPGAATSTVVWGDTTTNRLSSTSFTGDYRTPSDLFLSTTRPIMSLIGDLTSGTSLELGDGTYWLDWQTSGTLASGPFCPSIPAAAAANALQYNGSTGTWAAAVDTGNSSAAAFAFRINGTVIPEPSTYAAILGAAVLLVAGWRRHTRRS